MLFESLASPGLGSLGPWGQPLPERLQGLQDLIQSQVPSHLNATDPELDPQTLEALFEVGLFSLTVPENCGGLGASVPDFVRLMEAVGRLGPAWAITAVPHLCISVSAVDRLAREPLRHGVLSALQGDRSLLAFAITEDAGSDLAAMRTTLQQVDGRLVLRGRKQWVTNLSRASHIAVAALCPQLHPVPGAAIFVLVPRDAPGLYITKPWEKLEANGSDTGDLYLEDVPIQPEWLLGEPGEAFKHFNELVLPGRLGAGSAAIGMADLALDQARGDEVPTSTPPPALARLLQGARASLAWAAHLVEAKDTYRFAAVAYAKDLAGRLAQEVADVVDQGYANQGIPSPACVGRACGALGLFRLLKGPGEVLSIQATTMLSGPLRNVGECQGAWPQPLRQSYRKLHATLSVLEERPEGRNQTVILLMGEALSHFQAMLALTMGEECSPQALEPFAQRMHSALEMAQHLSQEGTFAFLEETYATAMPQITSKDPEEVDLQRELLEQVDAILRAGGSEMGPRTKPALDALGLFDPESLPWPCRRAVFQRLGEKAPGLVTTPGWLPSDANVIHAVRSGLLHRLLHQAHEHAEMRIMFRRPLVQQPSILFRLLRLRVLCCLVDTFSLTIPDQPSAEGGTWTVERAAPFSWLRSLGVAIRNDCQQIAGGTGYMLESGLAKTVRALQALDALLRPLEATPFPPSPLDMEHLLRLCKADEAGSCSMKVEDMVRILNLCALPVKVSA